MIFKLEVTCAVCGLSQEVKDMMPLKGPFYRTFTGWYRLEGPNGRYEFCSKDCLGKWNDLG